MEIILKIYRSKIYKFLKNCKKKNIYNKYIQMNGKKVNVVKSVKTQNSKINEEQKKAIKLGTKSKKLNVEVIKDYESSSEKTNEEDVSDLEDDEKFAEYKKKSNEDRKFKSEQRDKLLELFDTPEEQEDWGEAMYQLMLEYKWPYGQYKGKSFHTLAVKRNSYLRWCYRECDWVSDELKALIVFAHYYYNKFDINYKPKYPNKPKTATVTNTTTTASTPVVADNNSNNASIEAMKLQIQLLELKLKLAEAQIK